MLLAQTIHWLPYQYFAWALAFLFPIRGITQFTDVEMYFTWAGLQFCKEFQWIEAVGRRPIRYHLQITCFSEAWWNVINNRLSKGNLLWKKRTFASLIFECQREQLFPTFGDKLSEIRHIMNPSDLRRSRSQESLTWPLLNFPILAASVFFFFLSQVRVSGF